MGMFAGGIKFPTIESSGVSAPIAAPAAVAPPMAYAPRKRSFADNLGLLADAFQGTNRNGQLLAAQEARDFELWNRDALYQRKRVDDQADWQAQQQWKIDHPDTGPIDLQQRVDYLNTVSPGLGGTYATNYANNGGGAPQIITTPQGTFAVPRSAMTGATAGGGSVPDAAVSYLRQNPGMAAQFDAKYGAGSSARYLQGGAAPQAPAPFPTR